MARCEPYPLPGYERKSRGDESLIESIKKLQKEKERAKKEKRKEKKREKKESSREEPLATEHKEHHRKKRKHGERSQLNQNDGYYAKAREDAAEQLEKSGLTEESGPPSSIQNPYDSDGTEDCQKRQKLAHTDVGHKKSVTILRIRLPLVKHRDAEPAKPIESEQPATNDQPCFSGRVDPPPVQQEAAAEAVGSHFIPGSSHRTRKMDRKFGRLILNWNPPPMESERGDTDDLDWLLGSREQKAKPSWDGCKITAEGLGHGSSPASSFQPGSCYLPEVDMYALPYVVPY